MTDRTRRPVTDGPSIGERLKELREAAGLRQVDLAAAADVSPDLIRKLEQGVRHTASLPYLHRLAKALDVDLSKLIGKADTLPQPTDNSGVVALRTALTSVDDLILMSDDIPDHGLPLADMQRAVTFAWGAYWAGRYDQLAEMLPRELTRLRAVRPTGDAADLGAKLYQAAGCTLVHLGQPDAAHLAVREAIRLAEHGVDPLLPVALRGTLSWLCLTQGRYGEAYKLATAAARSIEPDTRTDLSRMSLWGSLLLSGATAAGRDGNRPNATHLLGEAEHVARHTGHRNDYECAFGPDQVTMQTVDVDVVTESFTAALTSAKRMPRATPLPTAARARHLQDRALAHTKLGHIEQATDTLLAMEQLVHPVWVRHQTHPKLIVQELRERERRTLGYTRLKDLASRWGVAG